MKKYFKKLDNSKWKVYLQLFFKKGTKFRLHLKPGITQFVDGDARIYFNNLKEEQSFLQHFDTKVIWSKEYDTKEEAQVMESKLLKYFGKPSKLNFETSGDSEVRDYNHQLWMSIKDSLYAA